MAKAKKEFVPKKTVEISGTVETYNGPPVVKKVQYCGDCIEYGEVMECRVRGGKRSPTAGEDCKHFGRRHG